MKFNSNKERREYWKLVQTKYSLMEINKAMLTLKPEAAKVLSLHYQQNHSFKDISEIMQKSITIIRNHHNRGIYKLYRYFNPRVTEIV
jgi:DNA-directed RNA polymerase specialized sigma24 family protein